MAVTVIPNVTNWTVTPQNGQAGYFTLMNQWLGESTDVIASMKTAITKQNTANAEINALAIQVANDAIIATGLANYQGMWSNSITYSKGQSVSVSGLYYTSKVDSNLNHAVTDTNYWLYGPINDKVNKTGNETISGNKSFTGNLLMTGASSVIGYGTGAGGTVTQLTSKSTSVTLNKPSGQIIMNNAALAAGTSVTFTLNNSLITSADNINIDSLQSVSSVYRTEKASIGTGVVNIRVTNTSAGSLSESLIIQFSIIKGAVA